MVAVGLFGYAAWAVWHAIAPNGMDALGRLVVLGFMLPVVCGFIQIAVVVRYRASAEVDPAKGLVRLSERVFRTRDEELTIEETTARLVFFKALVSPKTARGLVGPVLCLEGDEVSVSVMWPKDELEATELIRTFIETGKAMGVPLDLNPRVDRCGL